MLQSTSPATASAASYYANTYRGLERSVQNLIVVLSSTSSSKTLPAVDKEADERFKNLRSEAFWALRVLFQNGEIDIDPPGEAVFKIPGGFAVANKD